LAAPHTASIEAEHTIGIVESQRGPVTEHDTQGARASIGNLKPRQQACRRLLQRALVSERDPTVIATEAKAGQAVGDEPEPVEAAELWRPSIGLIAIHMLEEFHAVVVVAQYCFNFACALLRRYSIPLGWQPSVNERVAERRVMMQQRTIAQPMQQFVTVRRLQDVRQRVLALALSNTLCHGE
jgi:hypothetical protein